MNLDKSKLILKKLNSVHENAILSGEVSDIEKQLMLSYLEEMYQEMSGKSIHPTIEPSKPQEKIDEENPPVVHSTPVNVPEKPMAQNNIQTNAYDQELLQIKTNGTKEDVTHNPVKSVAPLKQEATLIQDIDSNIEALFSDKNLEDENYRFSQKPISDLNKALGINQKILIIKSLFNDDQQDFNYVLQKLNYFRTLDEAAHYLKTEIATKYDWTKESKRNQAIEFIKLVKRKF